MRVKILDFTRQGRVKVVWEGDATGLWVQNKIDILSGFDESNSQQLPLLKSYQGPVWDDDEGKFLYFSEKYSKVFQSPVVQRYKARNVRLWPMLRIANLAPPL